MNQNQQFESVIGGLTYARESLDPARSADARHRVRTCVDDLPDFGIMTSLPPWMCSPRGHINVSHLGSRSHYGSLYLANGLIVSSTEIYYFHSTLDGCRGDQNTERHGGDHAVPSSPDGNNTRGDVSTSNWYCHTIPVFVLGFHLNYFVIQRVVGYISLFPACSKPPSACVEQRKTTAGSSSTQSSLFPLGAT